MDRRQFVALGLMFGIKPRTLELKTTDPVVTKTQEILILQQEGPHKGRFVSYLTNNPKVLRVHSGSAIRLRVFKVQRSLGRYVLRTNQGILFTGKYWTCVNRKALLNYENQEPWTLNLCSVPIEGNGFKWFEARVYSPPDHRNLYAEAKSGMFEMIYGGK